MAPGTRLFHRRATGVDVTPEANELGRRLKLAGQEIEMGLRELDEARGVESGEIILGTLPYGGSMLLASVLDEFTQRYGKTLVRIVTEGANEMMHRLRFGDVDLVVGIIQETENSDLDNMAFAHTQFRIVGRKGHPLTGRAEVGLEELASYDWIIGLEGSSRRACFDTLFARHALPKAPLAISTLSIIRQLMADSDRLTLMTTYELRHESHALTDIRFPSVPGRPAVGITTRKGWLPTQIHRDFIHMVRRQVQDDENVHAS
ncbi:hypothetical protein BZG35_10660 [Brevundimonas sp. LM2]|uniref:LysR substrate-binding domain-containing protein n=1 Tax=Brevundimonas sp. LM2 TaxID=1938605 RepID=UPI000983BABB|nr:LysR substrate-binding domain-containing protein [Brevundimonas sp. LM2]AQR62052.1 hypothetical protein BZG35_10660 [Brevundimonas sp. LM2]